MGASSWPPAIGWDVASGGRLSSNHNPQVRLLAAALYDIRCLLGLHVGSEDGSPEAEAAAIAYALHNDALEILAGRTFDADAAFRRLARWDEIRGYGIADRVRALLDEQADAGGEP